MRVVPESRAETYERAHFDVAVPAGVVTLSTSGVVRGDAGWLPAGSVTVITGWNPGVERPSGSENESANRALEGELRGLGVRYWPAVGYSVDRSHAEPSFAVEGLSVAEARVLARAYRQAAVFRWEDGRGAIVWTEGERGSAG